jgi:hypothetical protein
VDDVAPVLTLDRAQEIYDGRGEPPTAAERETFEKSQKLWAIAAEKLVSDYHDWYRTRTRAEKAAIHEASEAVRRGTAPRRFGKWTPLAYGLYVARQRRVPRTRPHTHAPRSRRVARRSRARSPGRDPDRPHVVRRGGRR